MAETIDPRQISILTLRRDFRARTGVPTLPHATAKRWRATVMAAPDWPVMRDHYGIDARAARKADWQALAWLMGLAKPAMPAPCADERDALEAARTCEALLHVARKAGKPCLLFEHLESVLAPGSELSDAYARAYLRTLTEAAVIF